MKANDIVVRHPDFEDHTTFLQLLNGKDTDIDDVIGYIMDDQNRIDRRLRMLQHLDKMLGVEKDSYDVDDLRDFMADPENPKVKPHLSLVEYDMPTGNYAVCENCEGIGCGKCECGLIDLDSQ